MLSDLIKSCNCDAANLRLLVSSSVAFPFGRVVLRQAQYIILTLSIYHFERVNISYYASQYIILRNARFLFGILTEVIIGLARGTALDMVARGGGNGKEESALAVTGDGQVEFGTVHERCEDMARVVGINGVGS